MDDDFNTGGALGELFEIAHAVNRIVGNGRAASGAMPAAYLAAVTVLRELSQILGLFRKPPARPQVRGDGLTARPCSNSCSSFVPGSARTRTSPWPTRFAIA